MPKSFVKYSCQSLIIVLFILISLITVKAQKPFEEVQTLTKVAFTNVNIIDVEKERILPDRTVYIENGQIKAIREAKDIKLSEDTFLIEGKDKYLMPGLGDMHIHHTGNGAFSTGLEPPLYEEKDLMLYLVNGITTVRNMAGTEADITIKRKLASGELLGPHYYSSGPPIVTAQKGTQGYLIKTPQQAIDSVLAQKKAGFDFIKIYCCFKKENKDVYDKLIELSEANKIPAVGHIQILLPLEEALRLKTIEHFEHIPRYFHDEPPDIEKHGAILQKFLDSKIVVCPTLSPYDLSDIKVATPEALAHPENSYSRLPVSNASDNSTPSPTATYYYNLEMQYVYFFYKYKVPLILGTDSGGTPVIPGFGIHRELQLLNQAGLPPIAALQTGTINIAKFLGNAATRGSIAEGKDSDLVLLDENPLVAISNTRKIRGVMIGKNWLDKASIEKILVRLKKR